MRGLLAFLAFFHFISLAYGDSWAEYLISCEGARLEKICWNDQSGGCRTQLIVTSEHAKNFFIEKRMVRYTNPKGEVILPYVQSMPNSIDLIDEHDAFQGSNGRVFYIKPRSDRLIVEAFHTMQPTGGIFVQSKDPIGEYIFHSCFRY